MADARSEILARVRSALGDGGGGPALRPEISRAPVGREALVERFLSRVADYGATVRRVGAEEIGAAVDRVCADRGIRRLLVAPGVPDSWHPGLAGIVDDGLSPAELDAADAVLTGCALAIAETGTVVLDGRPPSGRRALTLVPDRHLCVVGTAAIVAGVPEAFAALAPDARHRGGGHAPITLVSGSSATSDIELRRVEGVHGPRDLVVIVAG